ncbi:MAG: aldose 1-epimerase family protein [Bacteroidota bacterium]|jgi:galactose mutarotase-like enzyme
MIFLENQFLKVSISEIGAEIKSVFSFKHQIEQIWNADPEYWNRSAPHLFPIVGELKNNAFSYQGKSYNLTRHGFIRNMLFEVIDLKADSVEFEFCANKETLKLFPFHFSFRIKYVLSENHIRCTYQIFNPKFDALIYSFGAHPGFMLHDSMENYFLEFQEEEDTERFRVVNGLLSTTSSNFKTEGNKLFLRKELFTNDALVFKSLKSRSAKLIHSKSGVSITLAWDKKFKFFGIWSQKNCDKFICLEPWAGIADTENFIGEFKDKEGVRCLEAYKSESFDLDFTFE